MHALYTGRPPAFDLFLDDDGAEAGRAFRHPDTRRPPFEKEPQEILLTEPYDALCATGHAHVRHVGRTTGHDAGVGGRNMGVGTDHRMRPEFHMMISFPKAPFASSVPSGYAITFNCKIL